MAGINIKNIPNATSLSTEDFVIVEQEAGTKKTSIKDLTKTGTVVHYSENPDNIVLQRPDMIEKINNMESNITSVTSQLEQNQKKIVNILTPELFGAVGDGVARRSSTYCSWQGGLGRGSSYVELDLRKSLLQGTPAGVMSQLVAVETGDPHGLIGGPWLLVIVARAAKT